MLRCVLYSFKFFYGARDETRASHKLDRLHRGVIPPALRYTGE
jgi:hypothetical protein